MVSWAVTEVPVGSPLLTVVVVAGGMTLIIWKEEQSAMREVGPGRVGFAGLVPVIARRQLSCRSSRVSKCDVLRVSGLKGVLRHCSVDQTAQRR